MCKHSPNWYQVMRPGKRAPSRSPGHTWGDLSGRPTVGVSTILLLGARLCQAQAGDKSRRAQALCWGCVPEQGPVQPGPGAGTGDWMAGVAGALGGPTSKGNWSRTMELTGDLVTQPH